jgi:hypothetical protein
MHTRMHHVRDGTSTTMAGRYLLLFARLKSELSMHQGVACFISFLFFVLSCAHQDTTQVVSIETAIFHFA